jgi:hypothetical protein
MTMDAMRRLLLRFAVVLLAVACALPAVARRHVADPEKAQLWTSGWFAVRSIDGAAVERSDVLLVEPGEHVVEFTITWETAVSRIEARWVVSAVFERGHTYAWQVYETGTDPWTTDLGADYVLPKPGRASRKAADKARWAPRHAIKVLSFPE